MIRRAAEVDAAVATGAVPVASLAAPPRRPGQPGPPPSAGRDPGQRGAPAGQAASTGRGAVLAPPAGPATREPDTDDEPDSAFGPGEVTSDPASASGEGAGHKPKRGRRRKSNFWRELPALVLVALLLTFLIQTFVARVYEIPSGSMEKTLHGCDGCNDDRVLVDKLSYRFGDPSPGDVVVFLGPPSWQSSDGDQTQRSSNPVLHVLQNAASLIGLASPDEEDFIKRVIAVGGQTVACCDDENRVTVDGRPLNEPYIYYVPDSLPKQQEKFGPVVVPKGALWMMGDSRNNSQDSRWPGQGPVPLSDVVGKARFVVLPLHRIRSVPDPNPQEVSLSAGTGPSGPPLALGLLGAVPVTLGGRQLGRRFRRWLTARRGDDPTKAS
jgi:signal peptidase I